MSSLWKSIERYFPHAFLLAVMACNDQETTNSRTNGTIKPGDDIEEWETYVSDPIPAGAPTKLEVGINKIEMAPDALPPDSRVRLRRVPTGERDALLASAQVESKDELIELEIVNGSMTETIPVELMTSPIWVGQRFAASNSESDAYFAYWADKPSPPTRADLKVMTKNSILIDKSTSSLALTDSGRLSITSTVRQSHFYYMAGFSLDMVSLAKTADQSPIATTSTTLISSTTLPPNPPADGGRGGDQPSPALALVDKIVVAEMNACMIRQGQLKCWGNNNYSQIGHINNTVVGDETAELASPFPDPNNEKYIDVAIGRGLICAITGTGKVKCAGFNDYNLKGHGSGVTSNNFTDAPTVNLGLGRKAKSIKAEGDTVCTLSEDHFVNCWGNIPGNASDGYAGGDNFGLEQPTYYFGSNAEVVDLTVGSNVICAMLNGGAVKCFGDNAHGQLGLGSIVARVAPPSSPASGDQLVAVNLGDAIHAKSIGANDRTLCVATNADELKCWGANAGGAYAPYLPGGTNPIGLMAPEMGNGLVSIDFGAGRTVKAFAGGGGALCALLDNDQVKCYGWNQLGQLGLGDSVNRGPFDTGKMGNNLPATNIIGSAIGRTVKSLAMGKNVSCALLDNLETKCWGKNQYGQLLGTAGSGEIRGDDPGEMGDQLSSLNLGW